MGKDLSGPIVDLEDLLGPMSTSWEVNTPLTRTPLHIRRALRMIGAREILRLHPPGAQLKLPPTLFPRILLSSPPSADCYKKTPQWSTFHNNNEAELELRKMEDWLTVDDEVDHLPSTPPSLLTSSDDNMSANKFIIWFLIS